MSNSGFLFSQFAVKLILIIGLLLSQQILATEITVIPRVMFNTDQTKEKKGKAAAQTTVIDRKKIQKSSVISIGELLKQQQSIVRVVSNSMDSDQTVLSLRGFGDNAVANTLILVDGFVLINASLFAPNFNAIPLADINNIVITQGSQGTLYGNQAVGGVVNIITRHPEHLLAEGDIGGGSYNSQFYNLFGGNKKSDGLFFKAFGTYNTSDNYRQHNDQNTNSAAIQVGRDYASGTLWVSAQGNNDSIEFPGELTQAQYHADPRQATDFNDFSHSHTELYQLFNNQGINQNWLLETHLQHQQINGNGFIFSNFNRNDATSIINPILKGSIGNNELIVGYEGVKADYNLSSSFVQSKTNSLENDLYSQIKIPWGHRFKFILGGREAIQDNCAYPVINKQSTDSTDRAFVTEQGVIFDLNNHWQFFLRRDGNFRFPKANELTWLQPGVFTLSPQTGTSYEAGVDWNTPRQNAQLHVYYLQLHNEIAFDPTQTPLNPFGAITNLPPTLRQGITFSETYNLNSEITVGGQINFVDARFNSGLYSGNQIPAVPAWTDNIDVAYQFASNWRTEYTAVYTGSRFASDDVVNTQRLREFWVNNISLQYFCKHFKVSFAINNFLNQRYPIFTDFDLDNQAIVYYPAAGRNYLLTISAFL